MNAILRYASAMPWALEPRVFGQLAAILIRHARGEQLEAKVLAEIVAARDAKVEQKRALPQSIDGVGLVPIRGIIARYSSQVESLSSEAGVSVEGIRRDLRTALNDGDVHSILLDIDSPGGSVSGLPELADEIAAANAEKPVYALGDGVMFSAAYWLGAMARQVFLTRASQVGSVGVVAQLLDDSSWQEKTGLHDVLIASSAAKIAGAPPIDDDDRAELARSVTTYYGMFRAAVGKHRELTGERLDAVADGRTHVGREGERLGFVDGIKTFDETMRHIQGERRRAQLLPAPGDAATSSHQQITDVPERSETAERVSDADPCGARPTLHPKGGDMTERTPPPAPQPTTLSGLTIESLTAQAPDLASALQARGAHLERERQAGIRQAAARDQDDLASRLIAEGASLEQATLQLHHDLRARHDAQIDQLRQERAPLEPLPAEPDPSHYTEPAGARPRAPTAPVASGTIEDQAKAEWMAADDKLRRSYGGRFSTFFSLYKRDPDFATGRTDAIDAGGER